MMKKIIMALIDHTQAIRFGIGDTYGIWVLAQCELNRTVEGAQHIALSHVLYEEDIHGRIDAASVHALVTQISEGGCLEGGCLEDDEAR